MKLPNDSVEIYVAVNGCRVREHFYNNLCYIEAVPGATYSLVSKLKLLDQALVSIVVDGLSVMTGKPKSINPQGYLSIPRCVLVTEGWRIDNSTVKAFRFTEDNGVITCAVYLLTNNNYILRHTLVLRYASRKFLMKKRLITYFSSWYSPISFLMTLISKTRRYHL